MEKSKRVKTKIDFQKVVSSKNKKNSKSFVILFLKREEYDYPRFGITASRKLGNAVTRVKIRRQVRAMLRDILKKINVLSQDYVIIVRNTYLKHTYQENTQELELLLRKMEDQSKWKIQTFGSLVYYF